MKTVSFAFACAGFVLALATPAHALNSHSFVSGNGSGTACTFAVPCAAIGFAVAATSSEGIVSCVDQGANSDGTVLDSCFSISKSITIDCAGVGSWYITINGSGIVVTLRNLQINMVGVSANNGIGIDFQNGAALFVEHCVIDSWNASWRWNPFRSNLRQHRTACDRQRHQEQRHSGRGRRHFCRADGRRDGAGHGRPYGDREKHQWHLCQRHGWDGSGRGQGQHDRQQRHQRRLGLHVRLDVIHCARSKRLRKQRRQRHQRARKRCLCVARQHHGSLERNGPDHVEWR